MDAATMAGGAPPQGQPQTGVGNVQSTPGQTQASDPGKIKQALEAALQQVVDKNGYIDMNKLVTLWPQVAQQFGINIPFQTVLQMLQQDPSLIEDIISQMGLAGITVHGKNISAEELLNQSQSGASAATASPAQTAAAPAMGG